MQKALTVTKNHKQRIILNGFFSSKWHVYFSSGQAELFTSPTPPQTLSEDTYINIGILAQGESGDTYINIGILAQGLG